MFNAGFKCPIASQSNDTICNCVPLRITTTTTTTMSIDTSTTSTWSTYTTSTAETTTTTYQSPEGEFLVIQFDVRSEFGLKLNASR